jgi:signal transduction histidine kinase
VLDNGPGVPPDAVERVFERFYQVDASRTGHDGTGLGLAICRHIVEAHGGRIWAEPNTSGGGGRFMFTLLNANELEPEDRRNEAIL